MSSRNTFSHKNSERKEPHPNPLRSNPIYLAPPETDGDRARSQGRDNPHDQPEYQDDGRDQSQEKNDKRARSEQKDGRQTQSENKSQSARPQHTDRNRIRSGQDEYPAQPQRDNRQAYLDHNSSVQSYQTGLYHPQSDQKSKYSIQSQDRNGYSIQAQLSYDGRAQAQDVYPFQAQKEKGDSLQSQHGRQVHLDYKDDVSAQSHQSDRYMYRAQPDHKDEHPIQPQEKSQRIQPEPKNDSRERKLEARSLTYSFSSNLIGGGSGAAPNKQTPGSGKSVKALVKWLENGPDKPCDETPTKESCSDAPDKEYDAGYDGTADDNDAADLAPAQANGFDPIYEATLEENAEGDVRNSNDGNTSVVTGLSSLWNSETVVDDDDLGDFGSALLETFLGPRGSDEKHGLTKPDDGSTTPDGKVSRPKKTPAYKRQARILVTPEQYGENPLFRSPLFTPEAPASSSRPSRISLVLARAIPDPIVATPSPRRPRASPFRLRTDEFMDEENSLTFLGYQRYLNNRPLGRCLDEMEEAEKKEAEKKEDEKAKGEEVGLHQDTEAVALRESLVFWDLVRVQLRIDEDEEPIGDSTSDGADHGLGPLTAEAARASSVPPAPARSPPPPPPPLHLAGPAGGGSSNRSGAVPPLSALSLSERERYTVDPVTGCAPFVSLDDMYPEPELPAALRSRQDQLPREGPLGPRGLYGPRGLRGARPGDSGSGAPSGGSSGPRSRLTQWPSFSSRAGTHGCWGADENENQSENEDGPKTMDEKMREIDALLASSSSDDQGRHRGRAGSGNNWGRAGSSAHGYGQRRHQRQH